MLTYSPVERQFVWDIDEIHAVPITPNVLDLLSAKMTNLSESMQTALKVAACFGIEVNTTIMKDLSRTEQYSDLLAGINEAVEVGLIDLDSDQSHYRFPHDKVREASYDMIDPDCRDKFHFDIGMAIISSHGTQVKEKRIVSMAILDQINHGHYLLADKSQRISVAKLNHAAASDMMKSFNYTVAYKLSNRAVSLLPVDSWSKNYDLSLEFYLLLANAAYSCRNMTEAKVSNFSDLLIIGEPTK